MSEEYALTGEWSQMGRIETLIDNLESDISTREDVDDEWKAQAKEVVEELKSRFDYGDVYYNNDEGYFTGTPAEWLIVTYDEKEAFGRAIEYMKAWLEECGHISDEGVVKTALDAFLNDDIDEDYVFDILDGGGCDVSSEDIYNILRAIKNGEEVIE